MLGQFFCPPSRFDGRRPFPAPTAQIESLSQTSRRLRRVWWRWTGLHWLTRLCRLWKLASRPEAGGGEPLKVHGYHVAPRQDVPLTQVLEFISNLQLARRLISVFGVPTRLESCREKRGFWLLDFTLIRDKGPGRSSPAEETQDFELAEGEGFGEETAALFDPATGFMTLQYNHYGPRSARIQAYLNAMARRAVNPQQHGHAPDDPYGFDLNPLLTAAAIERLDDFELVKSISASFYVPGVRARPEARRRSISGFLDLPLTGGAEQLKFKISAGRKKENHLSKSRVVQAVRELLGSPDDLSDLTVIAKRNEDAPSEPIDFLDARVEADEAIVADGSRYPRRERQRALARVFKEWRDAGLLNVQ